MRTKLKMLFGIVLLASGIANVGAQEFPKGEKTVVSRVQVDYIQVAPGLFIDTRIRSAAAASATQMRADVRLSKPMEDGSQSTMVAIKKGTNVAPGNAIENADCVK